MIAVLGSDVLILPVINIMVNKLLFHSRNQLIFFSIKKINRLLVNEMGPVKSRGVTDSKTDGRI